MEAFTSRDSGNGKRRKNLPGRYFCIAPLTASEWTAYVNFNFTARCCLAFCIGNKPVALFLSTTACSTSKKMHTSYFLSRVSKQTIIGSLLSYGCSPNRTTCKQRASEASRIDIFVYRKLAPTRSVSKSDAVGSVSASFKYDTCRSAYTAPPPNKGNRSKKKKEKTVVRNGQQGAAIERRDSRKGGGGLYCPSPFRRRITLAASLNFLKTPRQFKTLDNSLNA